MNPDILVQVAAYSGGILGGLLIVIMFVKQFLVIGRPNEVLVFSGRRH